MKRSSYLLSVLALGIGFSLLNLTTKETAEPPSVPSTPNVPQPMPSLAPMLEKVLPAVVSVQTQGASPLSHTSHSAQPSLTDLGSGVIIDAQKGYVLTNYHVIADAEKIKVQLGDGREFMATLKGSDEQTDIALLQIKNAKHLLQIAVANSDQLKVGDTVVAIGNPFGLGQTATSGIVSALGRSGLNLEGLENFIQTDAAINRGNSGGALVNLQGELVGLNTAILSADGGNIGIGFAIPGNMAITLAQQLMTSGEIQRGQLGIRGTDMTAEMAQAFHTETQRGAFVHEVLPDSAANKAGIKAGDIIISVNGQTIRNFAELQVKIGLSAPGQMVKIELEHAGKPATVTVKLDNSHSHTIRLEQLAPVFKGVSLSEGKTPQGIQGLHIDEIAADSPALQAGLQKGDVIISINRQAVSTLAELQKQLESKPSLLALNIIRNDNSLYLLLQ